MGIPNWLWPSDGTDPGPATPPLERTDAEEVSDAFETLSNPVRLEILGALYRHDEPLSYTELRSCLSVDDNGKLNYHLRRLREFVVSDEGEYALNESGVRVVRTVFAGDGLRSSK